LACLKRLATFPSRGQMPLPFSHRLRIGSSYKAVDVNDDQFCGPIWRRECDLPFACPDTLSDTELAQLNQLPNLGVEWALYEEGRYIHYEFTIANPDGQPARGGAGCVSAITVMAEAKGY